jgi:ribosomal protein L34E
MQKCDEKNILLQNIVSGKKREMLKLKKKEKKVE